MEKWEYDYLDQICFIDGIISRFLLKQQARIREGAEEILNLIM